MKTFDLMFCSLGNGTTICDRNREEYGDYKTVAHVAEWGGVHIRDAQLRRDPEALARVMTYARRIAAAARDEFMHLPYENQYRRWYGSMGLSQTIRDRDSWPVEKSPEWLYSQYIRNSNHWHGYEMPDA